MNEPRADRLIDKDAARALQAVLEEKDKRIEELESQLDAHEGWNARCPDCGRTHFTLLEDKSCDTCVKNKRIAELELERDEAREQAERFRSRWAVVNERIDPTQPFDGDNVFPWEKALEGET